MNIDLINTIVKVFFVQIFSFIIAMKLINYKKVKLSKIVIIILLSLVFSFTYIITKRYENMLLNVCIIYFVTSFIIKYVTQNNLGNSMLLAVISVSMSLLAFILAVCIEYIPFYIMSINNTIINLILIIVIQYIIIYLFFKINRFKNGLTFLKNASRNDFVDLIMTNISSIIILVYCMLGNYYGNLTRHILVVFFILGFIMVITIQKIIIIFYKQKLLNKTVKEYENEIKEKDEIIENLSNEKFKISKLNHEFYNRQKALELKVAEMNLEAGEEIGALERINKLTNEYSNRLEQIKGKPKIQLTNIEEIDDIFK